MKRFLKERSGDLPAGSRHLPEPAGDPPGPDASRPSPSRSAPARPRSKPIRARAPPPCGSPAAPPRRHGRAGKGCPDDRKGFQVRRLGRRRRRRRARLLHALAPGRHRARRAGQGRAADHRRQARDPLAADRARHPRPAVPARAVECRSAGAVGAGSAQFLQDEFTLARLYRNDPTVAERSAEVRIASADTGAAKPAESAKPAAPPVVQARR